LWIIDQLADHVPHTTGQVSIENSNDDQPEDLETIEQDVLSHDSVLSLGRFKYLLEHSIHSTLVEKHVHSG
jgi:hypothetical protein|tara:strand:+ start:197 stop:409 length:213 start_codon:yes stop_codon:yes gene_type:complete